MEEIYYLSEKMAGIKDMVGRLSIGSQADRVGYELELYFLEIQLEQLKMMEIISNRLTRLVEVTKGA